MNADMENLGSDEKASTDSLVLDSELPSELDSVAPGVSPSRDQQSGTQQPVRLLYLTNRMNLNGLLTSRMLAPRESFQKYYSDLLELTPGWVPILTAPPSIALIRLVTAERGAGAPVIVELAESVVGDVAADDAVVFIRAATMSDVTAIHFPDQRALRQHRAHGYSNVHPHEELLQVSPDLFGSRAAIDPVIAPPGDAPPIDWSRIDRTRGAIGAALAASDSGDSLAAAARLFGATGPTVDPTLPPWLTWPKLAGIDTDPPIGTDPEIADRLIFDTAYEVLARRDQTASWSPSETVDAVIAGVDSELVSTEIRRIIERNLQHVRAIVNIERDFEPFRNPGGPYVAAKSLLMVLLRPDLGELLDWSVEETGADDITRIVAAILAGRLRGLARESVSLRSMALDDATAGWAAHMAQRETCTLGTASFESNERETTLLLDGIALRSASPMIPMPVPIYEALSGDARRSARVAISRQLGWPVGLEVQLPSDAAVRRAGQLLTITSSAEIKVDTVVDEDDFLNHLRDLPASLRAAVNSQLRR